METNREALAEMGTNKIALVEMDTNRVDSLRWAQTK